MMPAALLTNLVFIHNRLKTRTASMCNWDMDIFHITSMRTKALSNKPSDYQHDLPCHGR